MVNRLDEEHLCLCPPIKLLTNSLLNSLKELTVFGGILLNHTRAGPLRVVRKALHIISSGTLWRCIVILKVTIWSKRLRVPSYESREGILNLGGKGWPLMEAMKGNSVWWTKSSTRFALLMFSLISSMTFLILIHLPLQLWHPSWSGTPWLAFGLSISSSIFLTLGLSFRVSFMAFPP